MKKNKLLRSLLCLSLAILLLFSAVSCNTTPPKPSETTEAIITDAGISGETTEEITSDAGIPEETTTEGEISEDETTEEVTTEAVVLSPAELAAKIEPGMKIEEVEALLGVPREEVIKKHNSYWKWFKWEFETGDILLVYTEHKEIRFIDYDIVVNSHFCENTPNPKGLATISEVIECLETAKTYGDIVDKLGYHGTPFTQLCNVEETKGVVNIYEWRLCGEFRLRLKFRHDSAIYCSFYDQILDPETIYSTYIHFIYHCPEAPSVSESKIAELTDTMTYEDVVSVLGNNGMSLFPENSYFPLYEWNLDTGMRLFIMFRKNDEGKLVVNRISVRPNAKEVTPKFITQELADKFVSDVTTYREAFSLFGNEYSYLRTSHSHSVVYSIWVDDYDGAIVRFYVTLPTPLYDNPIKRLTTLHPPEETEAQA